jgi:hypothetical protein
MSISVPPAPSFNGATTVSAESIDRMSGPEFEQLVARLLELMGFQVELTKASHDGGIDIVAHNHVPLLQGRYIIQCKRYDGPVGVAFIRDLFGVVTAERANKGILVTNSTFTASAEEFGSDKPLELIDGPKLLQLLARYQMTSVSQGTRSLATDREAGRLKQLVAAFPAELSWRVQLTKHVLGVIEVPAEISTRDDLMAYVEEAEIQLSAIHELSQKPGCCGSVEPQFIGTGSYRFSFFEHSSAMCLARLQLLQGKAAGAVRWMVEPVTYPHGDILCYPYYWDMLVLPNIINVANIAAASGKTHIRTQILGSFTDSVNRLVHTRKTHFMQMVKNYEKNSAIVQHLLDGLACLERIFDDSDIMFGSLRMVENYPALQQKPSEVIDIEVLALFFHHSRISQLLEPINGITLAEGPPFATQGDDVEQALAPLLASIKRSAKTQVQGTASSFQAWKWIGAWQKRLGT